MAQPKQGSTTNAWVAIDHGINDKENPSRYTLILKGARSLYQAIEDDDWVLVVNTNGNITRIGRVLRIRSDIDTTTFYFDRMLLADSTVLLSTTSLNPPVTGNVSRLQWTDFVEALLNALHMTIADIPSITNQTYIRELLQLAVMDDLLGPAGGPHEKIIDMGVRDRYLVGKLAPREATRVGVEGMEDPILDEGGTDDQRVPGQHEPGAEFGTATGRVEPEADSSDEIDAASNQSLIPSSLGLTFCVDGDVDVIEIEVRWGHYERSNEHEIFRTRKNKETGAEEQSKVKVWQRIPCGGMLAIALAEGPVPHQAPDKAYPEVRLQGSIRGKNANGDRLVTLFLVNAQEEPETNRDSGWVFQPEIIIRAEKGVSKRAIFRRRPVLDTDGEDPERESLEMIYRNRVEFAVGHGVAVHAETSEDVTLAIEVRTVVMPQYEVQVTETPGLDPTDRPAMKEMVSSGLLDMQRLATLECNELVEALSVLTKDYAAWIDEQRARVGNDVIGYDAQSQQAMDRCQDIHGRLQQGIDTLKSDEKALAAFRFANQAMATQRVRSLYSLAIRRSENVTVDQFDALKNRSWRPFQLAFLLLSIPSLANPNHPDRVKPIEAFADLLWFPTGGGKTEAYLGVAAFTMAIRRMQGNLGGYDSSITNPL